MQIPRTAMVAQPSTGTIVLVPFLAGYQIYRDLQDMIGGDHTARITRLIVDYCQLDKAAYYAQLQAIANLPNTNPGNIQGVEKMVMQLGQEVYVTFFNHKLFTPLGCFGYRLHQVMVSGKLALIHKRTL